VCVTVYMCVLFVYKYTLVYIPKNEEYYKSWLGLIFRAKGKKTNKINHSGR
jgi:hypothetical protein